MEDKKIKISEREKDGQFDLLVVQNRIGKFTITDALFETSLGEIMKTIFPRVFIIRAEHLYYCGAVEYIGYCDLFEPNKPGYLTPEYQFIFDRQPDKTILVDVRRLNK